MSKRLSEMIFAGGNSRAVTRVCSCGDGGLHGGRDRSSFRTHVARACGSRVTTCVSTISSLASVPGTGVSTALLLLTAQDTIEVLG